MDWLLIAVALGLVALGTFSMLVSTVSGGGMNVVMIPVLVLAFKFGPGEAIGTSFLALTIGSVVAAFRFFKGGHLDLRKGAILGASTVPGVVAGTYLSFLAEGDAFRILLGLVIIALAVVMAIRKSEGGIGTSGSDGKAIYVVNMKLGSFLMVCVGFFVGLFGQGGGLVLVPLVQLIGFPLVTTLGTVRLISILIGGTGFLSRLAVLQVNFPYGIALAVGTALGGFLGARVSTSLRVEALKLMAAIFIAVLGALLILTQAL